MLGGISKKNKLLILLCVLTGVTAIFFLPVTIISKTAPLWHPVFHTDEHKPGSLPLNASYEEPQYLICSIDDDPENYNNHGIYHPLELAVTVKNLQRIGIKHIFLGTHLHWPELDTQDNRTLSTAISELDSCIISIPLRRTAGPVEIPSYLLDSSISAEVINGDSKLLPKVNNLSLAPTFEIPKNTQAGFSQLETEPTTRKIPLIALWGERVILSSLLLERLHHLNIEPSDILIELGNSVILGDSGNIIPIDEFGYFSPNNYPDEVKPDILSSLITTHKKSPVETTNAILTAEGLKADSFRAINQPHIQLNQLTPSSANSQNKPYNTLHLLIHLANLPLIILLMISAQVLVGLRKFWWTTILILFWLLLIAIAVRTSLTYLVTAHLIVAILAACLYTYIQIKRNKKTIDQNHIDFDKVSDSFKESNRNDY